MPSLDAEAAGDLAKPLPTILRAIFLADLHAIPPVPFVERGALAQEVLLVHRDHQFAPSTAIEDFTAGLRWHVDTAAFDQAPARLPPEASAFWLIDATR